MPELLILGARSTFLLVTPEEEEEEADEPPGKTLIENGKSANA